MTDSHCDALVIGGGFFGAMIAIELRRCGLKRVILAEVGTALLSRASFVNQARVHNGYHYPRSSVTGAASRRYFERFCEDFGFAVLPGMDKYYAIAHGSRVSATQFERFCGEIGAFIAAAPQSVTRLFDPELITDVYRVREHAFDAAKLAAHLTKELAVWGVDVRLGTHCRFLAAKADAVGFALNGDTVWCDHAVNATYAALDRLGIDVRARIKREWAEIALIVPPPELASMGITVMDGPFFSTMPFPALGLHSLTHVRYTPLQAWEKDAPDTRLTPGRGKPVNALAMMRDAARYLPCLSKARLMDSLFDIKAVLAVSEESDARPILFEVSDVSPRIVTVLGGKIDNVYDVLHKIRSAFVKDMP